MQLLERKKS